MGAWFRVGAVALTLTVGLSGCSAPVTAASRDPQAMEEMFVTLLRAQLPDLPPIEDRYLVDAGRSICEDLDAGVSPYTVGLTARSETNSEFAGAVIAVAVPAFCPEYNDVLSQLYAGAE